jgi:hypothetical protein
VDWNVGNGGVNALIIETGTTTATNRSSITVKYNTKSPTSAEADAAFIEATKNGVTKTKKRTVFNVVWAALKFNGGVHGDNNLRFQNPTSGTFTHQCEFNWDGERGATVVAAKMEARLAFSPTGIIWSARGVNWKFSEDGGGAKFDFRLHRQRIWQLLWQLNAQANREIKFNDADWVFDGDSDPNDAQNPTDAKPNNAFRIDAPGFNADAVKQAGFRLDLRELAQWHNGFYWAQISDFSGALWRTNATAVLPNGTQGGTNNHGTGGADDVPNTRPVAHAGFTQFNIDSGANVTLDGTASSDADNDTWTYKWTQTAGPAVTLSSDTAAKPTFTAPTGPATLEFDLKISDITKDLHHHKPTNSESFSASVRILVKAP